MQKKIVFTDNRNGALTTRDQAFTVRSLVNSTKYFVGQHMSKDEVDRLCRDRFWTVTIQGGAK